MTKVHHTLTNKDIPAGAIFLTDSDTQKKIEAERMNKPYCCWDYEMNENREFVIPVGETFDYKGKTLKVVWDNHVCGCDNCFFNPGTLDCNCDRLACLGEERTDGKDVHFEEVKEGEPEDGATGITEKDGKKYRWTKVAAGYIVKEVEE